jgi:hypothetical protein
MPSLAIHWPASSVHDERIDMTSQSLRSAGASSVKLSGATIAITLLLSAGLACRSSSTGPTCLGEVTYEGKTFTGQGGNQQEAQRFACNNYCLDADPEFEAHYGIWLDSAAGRAAGRPPKKEAIYKDKELLDYLTKDCAMKCVAKITEGTLKGQARCQ